MGAYSKIQHAAQLENRIAYLERTDPGSKDLAKLKRELAKLKSTR